MTNTADDGWRMLPVRRFRDFGAVIKAVREDRDIPQAALADELAFTRFYLSEIEHGKPNLYITRLFRLLNRLNIRVELHYQLHFPTDPHA